jgi:hypothetical protein
VTDPAAFTVADNWTGGFYELGIELGASEDARLQRALDALWAAAGIEGCSPSRAAEPGDQPELPRTLASLELTGHLLGRIAVPGLGRMVCGAVVIRDLDGTHWLGLYLPLGALSLLELRVGAFPFGPDGDERSLAWRRPLDDWLAGIAAAVFRAVPFTMATVGFECLAEPSAADLDGRVPATRPAGLLLPDGAGGLSYHPATS